VPLSQARALFILRGTSLVGIRLWNLVYPRGFGVGAEVVPLFLSLKREVVTSEAFG